MYTFAGNSIGHPLQKGVFGPELKAAMSRILAATRKAGKKCGIYCKDSKQAREFAEQGYDMIVAVTDYTSIQQITRTELGLARGDSNPDGSGIF